LQPQETPKTIAFTCLWGQVDFYMFQQENAVAHSDRDIDILSDV